MDSNSKYIAEAVNDFSNTSFGEGNQFIVDSTHPSPAGVHVKWAYCLTDVTGFSATNPRLVSGSGAWPVDLVAGIQLPSDLHTITVSSGSILCFF